LLTSKPKALELHEVCASLEEDEKEKENSSQWGPGKEEEDNDEEEVATSRVCYHVNGNEEVQSVKRRCKKSTCSIGINKARFRLIQ
jgi:hypothetical protein